MSHTLNSTMQYGAACVLLGGLGCGMNPSVSHQVRSKVRQFEPEVHRRARIASGCGDVEICALVRPPFSVARSVMKRVLRTVLRI